MADKSKATTVNIAYGQLLGGMDHRIHPSLIKEGTYVRAVNMVVENGFPTTRDSFAKLGEIAKDVSGGYRGSAVRQYGVTSEIVLWIGQQLYVMNLLTGVAAKKTGQAGPLGTLGGTDLVTAVQTERYVTMLGASCQFYWDGTNVTLLTGLNYDQLPYGSALRYTCGRLFVIPDTIGAGTTPNMTFSANNGQSLLAGDLIGSGTPEDIFSFTEWKNASGGGYIGMPGSLGSMVALTDKPDQSGTGNSGLIVFCSNGIISYSVEKPRSNSTDTSYQWYPVASTTDSTKTSTFGTVIAQGITCTSPMGWVIANADVLFLAAGGVYSLNGVYRGGNWNAMNISPMSLALGPWNKLFAATSTMASNTIRAFATLNAVNGVFKGMASTNLLFNSSDYFGKVTSLWEGIQTGLPIRKIESAVLDNTRKLVMVTEQTDKIEVWVQTQDDLSENLESRIYMKQVDANIQTRLNYVELDGELKTNCQLTVYVRPYGCHLWYSLGTAKSLVNGTEQHAFSNLRFTLPDSVYKTRSGANQCSQTWDVCVVGKGHYTLRRTEIDCSPQPTQYNKAVSDVDLAGGMDLDATDFDYEWEAMP